MDNEFTIDIKILLSDLIRGFRKFWYIVLVLASAFSGICFYRSAKAYTPIYTAKATFTILAGYDDNDVGYNYRYYYNSQTASQMALTFPYILQSNLLQEIVRNNLGVSYLNGSISAMAIPNTNLFTMMVTSTNPQDAYNILNSVIDNYPKVSIFVIGDTKMNILSSPSVPVAPINSPSYSRMTKIGFLAGVLLGLAFIFLYAITRKTIREPEELKNKLNLKCLGIMPFVKFKQRNNKFDKSVNVLNNKTSSTFKESIRSLRTRILKEIGGEKSNIIAVTGSVPQEGKTTLTINLAISLAQLGHKVIVIDADLRNPSLLKRLDIIMPFYGLGEVLEGKAKLKESVQYLSKYNISVLAGNESYTNPAPLLSSPIIDKVFSELREMADLVIIDTPPSYVVPDSASIANHADYAIYAVRQDYANIGKIMDSITSLSYSKVKILGSVLTYAKTSIGSYGYKYGYRYKQYSNSRVQNENII